MMKKSALLEKRPNYFFIISLFAALLIIGLFFNSCKQSPKLPTVENSAAVTDGVPASPEVSKGSDSSFLTEAADINLLEIELGTLAQTHASSKDVKDFGKMMVDGHTKSLNELKSLAAKKGVALPQAVTNEEKKAIDELTKAESKDFDRKYIDKMVKGHTETITRFESARDNTVDASVKAWAVKTLPDLHRHLNHAIIVQQKIK